MEQTTIKQLKEPLVDHTGILFSTCSVILRELGNASMKRTTEMVDAFIESISEEKKPIALRGKDILYHSQSPRYPNGDLKPDFILESALSQENLDEAINLYAIKADINNDLILLNNYLRGIAFTLKKYLIGKQPSTCVTVLIGVLPDTFKQDNTIMDKFTIPITADINDSSRITRNLIPKEVIENWEKTDKPKLEELMEKYYALGLLDSY